MFSNMLIASKSIAKKKHFILFKLPLYAWQIDGETMETVTDLFWGAPKSLQMLTEAMNIKDACSLEEKL